MELPEVVLLLMALTASVLATVALLRSLVLKRRVERVLLSLNSAVLRRVVKSIEKRRKNKNRYLIVRFSTLRNVDLNEFQKLLEEAFTELYGKKNYSEASPKVLYCNEKTSKAVIRVRNHRKWSLLLTLAYLERKDFFSYVCPERVTGTYRKARKYADMT